jgi:hypothetical protein
MSFHCDFTGVMFYAGMMQHATGDIVAHCFSKNVYSIKWQEAVCKNLRYKQMPILTKQISLHKMMLKD